MNSGLATSCVFPGLTIMLHKTCNARVCEVRNAGSLILLTRFDNSTLIIRLLRVLIVNLDKTSV